MNVNARRSLVAGGFNAAFAVALGAGGAHALKAVLAANDVANNAANNFALALQYHQFHALGLILLGLVAERIPNSRCLVWAGYLMLAGIVLFSGGLYLLSLFGLQAIHVAIPFGGVSFIAAWLLFAIGILRATSPRSSG
jgi:uncharacterized membrane protein YgdD (TMEM256/DUF423 family)